MFRKKISAEYKNFLQNILFEPLMIFNPPIWEDSDSFCTNLETYTSFGRVNVDTLLVFAADSIKVSKSFQSWTSSFFFSL